MTEPLSPPPPGRPARWRSSAPTTRRPLRLNPSAALHSSTDLVNEVKTGNFASVKLLLERGFDIDAPDDLGYTALHEAAQGRNEAMVRFLLDNGARVGMFSLPTMETTALHLAVEDGGKEIRWCDLDAALVVEALRGRIMSWPQAAEYNMTTNKQTSLSKQDTT
ncbi:hypothetical protein BDD12DRAFT_879503 [Trichophaea hybrida]|nr:hypothetical protein BDD12DRAFT_879503 [Trichophaea hybrida]